jgi:hypothetical protein
VDLGKLAEFPHSLYAFSNSLFLSVITGNRAFFYAVQNCSYSDAWLILECGVLCCGGEIVVGIKERVEETGI